MSIKRARRVASVLGAATALTVAFAPMSASAAAFVLTPGELECFSEPGDVPGVDVFFPGRCSQVTTPSSNTVIIGRRQLPAGYTLSETFVGPVPCFGGTCRIVATGWLTDGLCPLGTARLPAPPTEDRACIACHLGANTTATQLQRNVPTATVTSAQPRR